MRQNEGDGHILFFFVYQRWSIDLLMQIIVTVFLSRKSFLIFPNHFIVSTHHGSIGTCIRSCKRLRTVLGLKWTGNSLRTMKTRCSFEIHIQKTIKSNKIIWGIDDISRCTFFWRGFRSNSRVCAWVQWAPVSFVPFSLRFMAFSSVFLSKTGLNMCRKQLSLEFLDSSWLQTVVYTSSSTKTQCKLNHFFTRYFVNYQW